MAVEEMSLLRGVPSGERTAVAPVILLPVRVIRTWTGPYFVWAVAPVTVRVVGAAEVVFGAEGALLVFAGADDTGCGGAALLEEEVDGVRPFSDGPFSDVFGGEGDADGDCEDTDEEGNAVASAVSAGVGVPALPSAGSVVGLSTSSSTMPETVPTVASSAWRNGCFFLMGVPAHRACEVSRSKGSAVKWDAAKAKKLFAELRNDRPVSIEEKG